MLRFGSSGQSGTDFAPATSGSAILKGNGSGGFSSAVSGTDYLAPGAAISVASVSVSDAPSASWALSSGTVAAAVTIANNGTYDVAAGSGFMVICASNGSRGIFISWFGGISLVYQESTNFSTSSGTASKTNVFYNAGTDRYRVENKSGGSLDYYFALFKIKATS